MTTMTRPVTGGVDTHLEVHVAAALDGRGAVLGVNSFDTTPAGYRALLSWLKLRASRARRRGGHGQLRGRAHPSPP
jgi:hypothetical protein